MSEFAYRSAALVTPSGTPRPEAMAAALRFLAERGVAVKNYAEGGYPSVAPRDRAAALTSAWLDPDCDVVLCARGGYGVAQIFEFLDWDRLRRLAPSKPVIGYSDITALHWAMLAKGAGRPVAGIMGCKLPEYVADTEAMTAYFQALRGGTFTVSASSCRILRPGTVRALPVVGNLAVSVTLCGTDYFPDLSGRILVLEDLNEPLYKLDRYLTQLSFNRVFDRCAGVVFGHFSDCAPESELEALFRRVTKLVKGPVWMNFPFGHQLPFCSIDLSRPMEIAPDRIVLG